MTEHEANDDLGISELDRQLVEQQRLLADMEEQLVFLLRSTGHHIGGAKRKREEAKVSEQRLLVEALCAQKKELQPGVATIVDLGADGARATSAIGCPSTNISKIFIDLASARC